MTLCYSESSSSLYLLSAVSPCLPLSLSFPSPSFESLDKNRWHTISRFLLLVSRSDQKKWIHLPPVSLLLCHCFLSLSSFCVCSLSFPLPCYSFVVFFISVDLYISGLKQLVCYNKLKMNVMVGSSFSHLSSKNAASNFSNMRMCSFSFVFIIFFLSAGQKKQFEDFFWFWKLSDIL